MGHLKAIYVTVVLSTLCKQWGNQDIIQGWAGWGYVEWAAQINMNRPCQMEVSVLHSFYSMY